MSLDKIIALVISIILALIAWRLLILRNKWRNEENFTWSWRKQIQDLLSAAYPGAKIDWQNNSLIVPNHYHNRLSEVSHYAEQIVRDSGGEWELYPERAKYIG